jgi:hypothetical protein
MFLRTKTLDAENMARFLPKILGRVASSHESFQIVKEGVPCAFLIPAQEPNCDTHGFADDIEGVRLSAKDRRALSSAIRHGRKMLKPLKNPWG